jgi:hypothetical protein
MGVGEFEASLPNSISVRVAQLFFLLKAGEVQPELIDDLYLLSAPAFSRLFNSPCFYSPPNPSLWTPPQFIMKCKSIKDTIFNRAPSWWEIVTDADGIAVKKALPEWSRRWNLNAEWCLDYALILLWLHCRQGRVGFVNVQGYNAFLRADWHISTFTAWEIVRERLLQLRHPSNAHKQSDWQMLLSRYDGQAKFINWLLVSRTYKTRPHPPERWPEWDSTEETRESYLSSLEKESIKSIESNPLLSVGHRQRKRALVEAF